MAKITYFDEFGAEQEIHVGPDRPEIVVGRVKTCDLVTTNLTVSRRHASISFENGGYVLRDLGSANGTFFRKERVSEVNLVPDEPVFVGAFPLSFHLEIADMNAPDQVDVTPVSAPPPVRPVAVPDPVVQHPVVQPAMVPPPVVQAPAAAPAAVPAQSENRPRQVPLAYRADWKPSASVLRGDPTPAQPPAPPTVARKPQVQPAVEAPDASDHLLSVGELEDLLARERMESGRLGEALYVAESALVDLRSSMAMVEEENRSMAVSLDTLDREIVDKFGELESLRDDRDRFELEASSLRSEVESLRQMTESGSNRELEAAHAEIESLKLASRGYLKRIGKLLEDKEKLMPGGVSVPSAAVGLSDEINELASTALAGLDAAVATLGDSGAADGGDVIREVRTIIADAAGCVRDLKKDVQELSLQLKESFNNH